jgi:hemerythrin-like metal-binding protein
MLTESSSQELCYQYLNRVIKDLKIHFESEEEILQLKAYPDLKYHAKCHADLMEKALHLKILFENNEIRLEEVLAFVIHDIVAEHLFKEDKKFFSFIQS